MTMNDTHAVNSEESLRAMLRDLIRGTCLTGLTPHTAANVLCDLTGQTISTLTVIAWMESDAAAGLLIKYETPARYVWAQNEAKQWARQGWTR
jgi:hypothetical protein